MEKAEERRYEGLSPFELKNKLIELAQAPRRADDAQRRPRQPELGRARAARGVLSPGRVRARRGRAQSPSPRDFGGLPKKRGIAEAPARLPRRATPARPGDALLARGIAYARDVHGFDPDLLVGEWVDGVLGDHYPLPVRMLAHAETLVRAHLVAELFGGDAAAGRFDLFAVEGASAGITYVFQSLVHSRLLAPGDRIALGVPIFTPYLEVPRLPEYRFELVEVMQDEAAGLALPGGRDRQAARSAGQGVPRRESVESDGGRDGCGDRRAHRRDRRARAPSSS